MVSTRASNATKNPGHVDAPMPRRRTSAVNATKASKAAAKAEKQAKKNTIKELDTQLIFNQTNRRGESTTTDTHLAHPPAPLGRHETTSSRKRKRADTSSIAEDAPEAPSPAPKILDVDDPGYETVTTVMASDYEDNNDSDTSGRPLAKRVRALPPAPQRDVNVNNGHIRSRAHPVAQCLQPPTLAPTLAELRARTDVPTAIKDWVALSTATGLYDEDDRLPPHFGRSYPHLFAPGPSVVRPTSTLTAGPSRPTPTLYPVRFGGSGLFPSSAEVTTLAVPATPYIGAPKPKIRNNADGRSRIGDRPLRVDEEVSGSRKDGSSMAKAVELDDEPSGSKSRAAAENSNLPMGALGGNRWRGRFIPTLLEYLGTLMNPWDLPDGVIIPILQNVWDVVYGDSLPWTVNVNDGVHAMAMQRIYEWQGYFGSSALRAFELLFQSSPREFPDFVARAEFCKEIAKGARLFYECSDDGENKGLYRSTFVLAALSEHVDAIRGAVHVPKLYAAGSVKHPYGAIGLAAAAVFRAALLFSLKKVSYDDHKRLIILKTISNSAGKPSTNDTTFSEQNYGEKTMEYAISASKLPAAKIEMIVDYASQTILEGRAPDLASTSFNANDVNFDFSNLVDVE